jgi:uncharacterized protein with HEPN domain
MLRRIENSTAQGRDAFETDLDVQDATLRRLQTLSESVQRLSGEFKEAHPEVPWDLIAGMRNRLVHAYLDVDLEIVWNTVLSDLPPVRAVVDQALTELPSPEGGDPT